MKIAIISSREQEIYNSGDFDSNSLFIPYHITEWTEVSDNEYNMLVEATNTTLAVYQGRYSIIHFPPQKETIAELIAMAKEKRDALIKEKAKQAANEAERAENYRKKKELKTIAEKERLFEQLKKELKK